MPTDAELEARWAAERQRVADRAAKTAYRKYPMPEWPKARRGASWCTWCGNRIWHDKGKRKGEPNMRRTWHPRCYADYRAHTESGYQYRILAAKGEKCAACPGYDGHWVRNAPSTYRGDDATRWAYPQWQLRKGSDDQQDIVLGQYCFTYWTTRLEVDHVIPLWSVRDLPVEERRPYYGPANLQLLCPAHHKAKSKRESAERARQRAVTRSQLNLAI